MPVLCEEHSKTLPVLLLELAKQDKKYQDEKAKQEKQSNHNKQQRQSYTYSDEEREEARKDQQQKQKEQEKKEEKSKHTQWDSSDYYIVLGLKRTATFEEIKKKYKQLSRISP